MGKFAKWLLVLVAVAVLATILQKFTGEEPEPIQPLFRLTDVTEKTPEQVEVVLGKAVKLEPVKQGPKYSYQSGAVEVVYINGKADWITVSINGPKWDKNALAVIGLEPTTPTESTPDVLRWRNISGIREIALFPKADQTIDYVYVKTRTE